MKELSMSAAAPEVTSNGDVYSNDDHEFLFPTRLQLSPPPIGKVLFVGSCMIELFLQNFIDQKVSVPYDFILFNNAAELPENPPSPILDYSLQFLQIPLRSLLTDRVINFKDLLSRDEFGSVLENAMQRLDIMLDAGLRYNARENILTVVTNFMTPQTAVVACLKDVGTDRDLAYIVRRLNEHLAMRIAERNNVYLIDQDALANNIGKAHISDDWYHIFSHNSTFPGEWTETPAPPFFLSFEWLRINEFRPTFFNEFYHLIWKNIVAIVRTVRQVDQVKLVIFDLDNTLWRGQIAEHYRDDAERPLAFGWPEELAETIHHLRARGILVAICSKNDLDVVRDRWERAHPYGWIKLDDFVVAKINWQPKPVNIAEILEAVNLTPKSVVFVDDNPLERDAVKTAFPAMRVIGENPFLTRSILLRAPETQVAVRTQESARREVMIRGQMDREKERVALSREQFLASLDARLTIEIISSGDHEKFPRAFELINKTNQFNTTGRRWAPAEMTAFLGRGGELVTVNVKDKFSDYGLVGVAILDGRTIEQFVMSCRVLGLDIEKGTLTKVIDYLRGERGEGPVSSLVKETPDNMVCREVFANSGFDRAADENLFVYSAPAAPETPPHLAIDFIVRQPAE